MERAPLYAQFDGDEIDGKRYALGDEVDSSVDGGTIAYLVESGRLSAAKPGSVINVPSPEKALADMSRAELEATARAEMPLGDVSDDDLIAGIERAREASGSDAGEKPLNRQTKAELEATAAAEGVTFGEDVKTNEDRAAAIQAKRDAA